MTLKAIIFDVDGALTNAEPDGHLKSFTLSEYTVTKNFKGALVVLEHLGQDN